MMNIKFMILTLRHRTLLSMHAYIHTDVRTYIYIYTYIYTSIIHTHMYICMNKGKGKATPLHASTVPEGSRMLRLPVSKTIGGNVSPTHRPPLRLQEIFLVLISVRD